VSVEVAEVMQKNPKRQQSEKTTRQQGNKAINQPTVNKGSVR
jgi:hypothetical protein